MIFEHGFSGYTNHGCRCDVCTKANAVHSQELRGRRWREAQLKKLAIEGHANYEKYVTEGCRCIYCTAAYLDTSMRKGLLPRQLRNKLPWIREYRRVPSV